MTAGFAPFWTSRRAADLAAMAGFPGEPEEDEAVPVAASHLVGNGAERTEDPAVVLKTGGEDFNEHRFPFKAAPEKCSGWRQPGVMAKRDSRIYRAGRGVSPGAKSGLPGDCKSMLARLLGQPAFGAGLQFPREFSPHIKDMDDGAVFSEQLAVHLLQGRNTEVHQALNDSVSVHRYIFLHGVNTMYALYRAVSKRTDQLVFI